MGGPVIRHLELALLLAVAAAGCAHGPTRPEWSREAFEKELNEFVGKPVESVIDEFGYPQRELAGPRGQPVYEYNFYNTYREPLYAYPRFPDWGMAAPAVVRGGESYVYGCTIWFALKEDRTVAKARFRGNACEAPIAPSAEPDKTAEPSPKPSP